MVVVWVAVLVVLSFLICTAIAAFSWSELRSCCQCSSPNADIACTGLARWIVPWCPA
jgi:hypothetical protein